MRKGIGAMERSLQAVTLWLEGSYPIAAVITRIVRVIHTTMAAEAWIARTSPAMTGLTECLLEAIDQAGSQAPQQFRIEIHAFVQRAAFRVEHARLGGRSLSNG